MGRNFIMHDYCQHILMIALAVALFMPDLWQLSQVSNDHDDAKVCCVASRFQGCGVQKQVSKLEIAYSAPLPSFRSPSLTRARTHACAYFLFATFVSSEPYL